MAAGAVSAGTALFIFAKGFVMMKNRSYILGFDDRWLLVFGLPLVSFLVPILFFKADLSNGLPAYLPEWGISLMFTVAYWFSMRHIFIVMRLRFPKYEQTTRRIVLTTAFGLAIFFLLNYLLKGVHEWIRPYPERPGVTDFDYTVASLTVLTLVSAIYESVFLYYRWKESILETERLRRENLESQLAGLRQQVNPHFLFNSLNTLSYLITEDPDKAVRFVQQLSKVYRYVLELHDQRLISLQEELSFMNSYLFLLKERFGDNLRFRLDLPEHYNGWRIVPLSLQMLLENVIKHNVISHDHPLTIEIRVDEGQLMVRNNLQRKNQQMPSTRVGLDNIRNRYAFFTDDEVRVEELDGFFTVCVPLIEMNPEAAV